MPHRFSVKTYIKDGLYHAYNRGVEKREIFVDNQDYTVFLHLLKYYLSPTEKEFTHPLINVISYSTIKPKPLFNLDKDIDLLAFCLMPNHFHLLLRQNTIDGMTKLMRRLLTTYSVYFNKRYQRVGTLFQGKYKAALIADDSYLLYLSRYIHLNPTESKRTDLFTNAASYPYSSYQYYLGLKKADWIKPQFILKYFNSSKLLPSLNKYPSYKKFVEGNPNDPRDSIGALIIETD